MDCKKLIEFVLFIFIKFNCLPIMIFKTRKGVRSHIYVASPHYHHFSSIDLDDQEAGGFLNRLVNGNNDRTTIFHRLDHGACESSSNPSNVRTPPKHGKLYRSTSESSRVTFQHTTTRLVPRDAWNISRVHQTVTSTHVLSQVSLSD